MNILEKDFLKRAEHLLGQMTLKEKVGQLNQKLFGWECYRKTGETTYEITDMLKEEVERYHGLGVLYGLFRADPWSKVTFQTGVRAQFAPKVSNHIQRYVLERSRLSIPVLMTTECPHGQQALDGYLLPVNLAIGATFNPLIVAKGFEKAAQQCRGFGMHVALISMLDILRDPRWGRSEECYSEDPYLSAVMAATVVRTVQGSRKEDLSRWDKLAVIAKHFCAQGACTGGVNLFPANIGERELREIHLPGMQACCKEQVAGCMAAYNEIDGIPCHANAKLLNGILRDEFGFKGVVMADGGAVDRLCMQTGDTVKAGALAVGSGVDISLWDDGFPSLVQAVQNGYVSENIVDRAVLRVLCLKLQLGLFEHPFVDETNIKYACLHHTKDDGSLNVARESVILLKNNNHILPVSPSVKKIAVIGPNADNLYNQMGDYTPPLGQDDGVTLLSAIKSLFSGQVFYTIGCQIRTEADKNIEQAKQAAAAADIVILALGGSSTREFDMIFDSNGAAISQSGENMDCGEGVDLSNLDIGKPQQELFEAVCSVGKPVITVLIQGRPHSIDAISQQSDALLCAFYPGPMGGQAIAEILFGKISPSGRLPVTIPRSSSQLPVFYNHKNIGYEPHYMDILQPEYPFGFGLTYGDIIYKSPEIITPNITLQDITAGGKIIVETKISNQGKYACKETVQLYIQDCEATIIPRIRQLKGFTKIHLHPGETKSLSFAIGIDELAIWDHNMVYTVEPGRFVFYIGSDSETDNSTDFVLL